MPGAKALPTRKLVALRLELPADMPGAQALPTQRSVAPKLALSADVPGARALPTRRPGFCSGPDSAATLLGRGLALPFCPLGLVRVARQARRDRRFARVLPGPPDKGPVGRLFGPGAYYTALGMGSGSAAALTALRPCAVAGCNDDE